MQAVGVLWRSRLRRHWVSWVAVSVLIGIGAGAGMACLAGARRTASWFDRIAVTGMVPDVNSGHGLPPEEAEKITAGFDGVARHSTVAGFTGYVEGLDRTLIKYFIGAWDEPVDVQRPLLREGRYPDPDDPHEILVAGRGAETAQLDPGDELTVSFFLNDFSGQVSEDFVVAGIGEHVVEALSDAGQDRSGIFFTPAFSAANNERLRVWSATAIVAEPGRVDDVFDQVLDAGWALDETRATTHRRVQDAIRPLIITLAILGALLLVTTLVLAGQALARQSDANRRDRDAIRAMGFGGRQLVVADLLTALAIGVPGALLAAGIAFALSPLAPIGAVRTFEPEKGLDLDLTVIGLGSLALVVVIVTAHLTRRAGLSADEGQARPILPQATLGPALSGVRLATGGTRSHRRRFWVTVAFSAFALMLVVAGIAFAGALDRLTQEPVRYGVGWELTARAAFGDVDPDDLRDRFGDDPDIDGISAATLGTAQIDDVASPLLAVLPITDALWPTVVDGREPTRSGEILVGKAVLDGLDADIGDTVTVADPKRSTTSGTGSGEAKIVGTAVFPSIDLAGYDPTRLDKGIAMTWRQVQTIFGANAGGLPDLAFMDLADGVDAQTVIERYPEGLPEQTGIAPTEWLSSLAPAEIIEADRATALVWTVIALLGVVVLGALGHSLVSGVRRQRADYAVLKTLGFTRRQVLTSVASQSIVTMVVALVIAIPLGTALGRALWRSFAQVIGVIDTPVVPVLALVVVTVGTVVAGVLIAAGPGIVAARTSPAAMLTNE